MKNLSVSLASLALASLLALPTALLADDDLSSVNKSLRVENGSSVGDVSSVNGSIRIGSDALVRSVESVNGSIKMAEGAKVEKNVEAVNGTIQLAQGADVGGNIETVNGGIKLDKTNVAGDVSTVNGGVRLISGTMVEGDVVVRKPSGWSSKRNKPVKVVIGEDVIVAGDLVFEQPVELTLHESAKFGKIVGDEVTINKD